MTISLAIALIVIADVALMAGLAYVMSRASKLEPHVSATSAQAVEIVSPATRARTHRPQRLSGVPAAARS